MLQYDLHNNTGQPQKAADALLKVIECREAIVLFPSRNTAFKWEYLGDILQEACSGATKQSHPILVEAQKAYKQAVQLLLLVAGQSHPYSACATRKLVAVQGRLPIEAIALGPELCNLCGGKTVPHGDDTIESVAKDGNKKALSSCGRCIC